MSIKMKRVVSYLGFLTICLPVILISCKSKDKKLPDKNIADNIYFDYKISAEEGYDNLTVLLKYRDGDKTGEAFTPAVLENVKLDDEILVPDSSKLNGVFYEIQKPINTFTGKHYFAGLENEDYVRIVLTDTSFFNDGINRIDAVLNNQMILPKKDLDNLADGPILLEFIREFERPIKNAGEVGGRVRINYTLRRSFNLQN